MPKYSPFQRSHRKAARLALYSSAILSGLAVYGLTSLFNTTLETLPEKSESLAYWEADPDVRLLQSYIQIDTSEREIEGARFLAEQLTAMGLDPVIEELGDGRANVWAILEGKRSEALVLHNHIDTFHVTKPKRWKHGPFSGTIDPPFLYGRGAFDMKSVAIAQLRALERLAQAPQPPELSVIFLATADEETGSRLGARWILREHPELVERFAAVLTEGGVVEPVSVEAIKYWGIETGQKRFVDGHACATDRESLVWLRRAIRRQRLRYQVPVVTRPVAEFFETYASTREDDYLSRTLERIVAGEIDPIRFNKAPRYLKALFYNELVAFPIEDLDDGTFRVRLALHLLPGADFEEALADRLPDWMRHGVDISFAEPLGTSSASPADSPAFRALKSVIVERFPGTPVGPHFLGWTATDARFFRQAGIPTYGFSPFLIFNTESYRADQENERINLPGFVDGLELYVEAVAALVDSPDAVD